MKPLLLSLAILLCAGCARIATETAVAEDGSWTRSLRFTIPKEGQMGGETPKFEDSFVVPSAGWKVERTTDKDNQILKATRSAKLGETILRDLQVKSKKGLICVNQVSVTKVGDNRFEYKEIIKYVGADKPDLNDAKTWLKPMLKEELPAGVEDAALDRISLAVFAELWRLLFGPGEPLIPQLLFSPEIAERRIRARFAKALDVLLARELGDKVAVEARRKSIRGFIARLDSNKIIEGPKEKQKEGPSDDSNMIAMFSAVKLPGTIVESNGEIDEVSGEVYWAFYPECAQLGDVELRAVCEVKP